MDIYLLAIDTWEADVVIDEPQLVDEDVKLHIIRLNGLDGGLRLDKEFPRQWAESEPWFRRTIYFVYNPWKTPEQNFDFLMRHKPATVQRVLNDIEVRRPGYSPSAYGRDLRRFRSLVSNHCADAIYTGGWFLEVLDEWPVDCWYWWGRYPYVLYPPERQAITWAELRAKLEILPWSPGPTPGPCKLWQCSAERYILPGCGGRALDINIWNGTLAELDAWLAGGDPVPAQPPPPQPGEGKRLMVIQEGLYVRTGPSRSYGVVTQLTAGQILIPLDIGGTDAWAQVRLENGVEGWANIQLNNDCNMVVV